MPSNSTDIVEREWGRWVERCGFAPSRAASCLAELQRLYGEPHRHYHNLDHIATLLERCRERRFRSPGAAIGAVFYHDAIYRVGYAHNEADSAALAIAHLTALGDEDLGFRTAALIEATATHEATGNDDKDLFCDMDMAVLGDLPKAYERYRNAVMAEYTTLYEPAAYRAGRVTQFLDPILKRERIFITKAYEGYEEQARENMRAEREWLLAGRTL